jgi:hypothetical protein
LFIFPDGSMNRAGWCAVWTKRRTNRKMKRKTSALSLICSPKGHNACVCT